MEIINIRFFAILFSIYLCAETAHYWSIVGDHSHIFNGHSVSIEQTMYEEYGFSKNRSLIFDLIRDNSRDIFYSLNALVFFFSLISNFYLSFFRYVAVTHFIRELSINTFVSKEHIDYFQLLKFLCCETILIMGCVYVASYQKKEDDYNFSERSTDNDSIQSYFKRQKRRTTTDL